MTTYQLKLICPRCPNRQVVTVSFTNPTHITYECQSCQATWETSERHRRPAATP